MTRSMPVFSACLFVLLAATAAAPGALAAPTPGVAWRGWDRGIQEAKSSDRPVLVDVVTSWCGWCKRMDADVYARADVREYLAKKFVTVRINAEAADAAHYEGKAYTSRTLAARFGVTGYPTTLFLRAAGDRPVSVPGYQKPEEFMLILRYIGDGHMEAGVSFQEFQKRAAAKH